MEASDSDRRRQGYMFRGVERSQVLKISGAALKSWFGSLHQWGSLVLVFLALGIAVNSIEQARWITPQPSLMLVLFLAILASLLLLKSRLNSKAAHLSIIFLGAIVTIWQSSRLLGLSGMIENLNPFVATLQYWWWAVTLTKPNEGIIHFAIFLVFSTWVIGYISTWYILRRQNPWVAISLGTVTILINLSNLPAEFYLFLPIFLVAAILLIGQTNMAKQDNWLKKYSIGFARRDMTRFMTVVLGLSIVTVSSTSFVPQIQLNQMGSVVSSEKQWVKDLQGHWLNLFAAVPGKWSIMRSSEQEELSFREAVARSGKIQFIVTSDRPLYWRTRRYDTYHSWGWTSSATIDYQLEPGIPANGAGTSPNRREFSYTVESKLKTDVLLAAGEFVSSDIPVLLQTLPATSTARSLPTKVPPTASDPGTHQLAALVLKPDGIGEFISGRMMLTGVVDDGYLQARTSSGSASTNEEPAEIEANRAKGIDQDIMAVTTPRLLQPNQRYTVTASVISATTDELAQAGENYPEWVEDYYLQLPDSLPERLKRFADVLTDGMETPYEKVTAIKRFLNSLRYNRAAKLPPEGVECVDYFIFEQQEGDCVNFASAMAVMLRSVDVPARLCTGYLRGEWHKDTGQLLLRARHYHAWPEVYFPGYGWVELEATPTAEDDLIIASGSDSQLDYDEWLEEELFDVGGDEGVLGGTSSVRPKIDIPLLMINSLLFVILVAGLIFRRWLRQFRGAERAYEAYARMCFLASLIRSGPRAQETPFEYCARLSLVFPLQAEAISNIGQAYIETQYSPRRELESYQKTQLQKSWELVYRVLIKRLWRLRRGS